MSFLEPAFAGDPARVAKRAEDGATSEPVVTPDQQPSNRLPSHAKPPVGRWLRERLDLSAVIRLFVIVVIAVNAAVLIRTGQMEREKAIASTIRDNSRLAVGFEQYIERTIASVDTTTQLLKRELARERPQIDLAQLLSERVIDPELVSAALIFNERGEVIASSQPSAGEFPQNAANRRDFEFHATHDTGEVFIGHAEEVAGSGRAAVPVSRRFNRADGTFGGMVLLQMNGSQLTRFYDTVAIRPHDVRSVIGIDGALRARRSGPTQTAIENLKHVPIGAADLGSREGHFTSRGIDGVARLISYRRMERYPLIVAVGVSLADATAEVTRRVRSYYVRAAVLTALIAFFAGLLIRALKRRKKVIARLTTSEATLRAREQELRALTESMPQLVWIADSNGRQTFFNRRWIEYTGLSLDETVRDGWMAAFHPEDAPQVVERWQDAVGHGQVFEMEFRLRRADGTYHWMLGRAVPVQEESGGVAEWFGTCTDIDQQLAAQHRASEQAELLNLTDDAIIVREFDDTIRFWNRGAEELYGWAADEVIGKKIVDDVYEDEAAFQSAMLALEQQGHWSGELQQRRRNGETVVVNSRWKLVPTSRSGAKSILIVETDITERRNFEQQLLRTQRLESIGTLASGVAHDLNNVLSPVLMAAPLLRGEISAEKRDKLVTLIEQSAERGAGIVQQVLTFARGADGERVLVQPANLVTELAKMAEETFPKSISIHTSYPEHLWLIEADPTQLQQVLLNLCVNARDAMSDGGSLSLSAENFDVDEAYATMTPGARPGPHVAIEVSDTGPGIPQHVLDKIYDPFFTTKPLGKGTGLGLSTALGIVRSHGGVLRAVPRSHGTTFQILLPAVRGAAPRNQGSALADPPAGNGETILVVDDEVTVREATEAVLLKSGYKVLLAIDAPAALTVFAEHSAVIDLVLTDLTMPIMNGVALARTIRKMKSEARIIIATGHENDFSAGELAAAGIDMALAKPYSRSALLRTLHQVLHPSTDPTS